MTDKQDDDAQRDAVQLASILGPTEMPSYRIELLVTVVEENDANNALWHFFPKGTGLREPGSFIQALVTAIAAADPHNQARLAYGFPGLVAAVQMLQGATEGTNRLRGILGLDPVEE